MAPSNLADRFEAALALIPDTSHLVLVNPTNRMVACGPPSSAEADQSGLDHEHSFPLPAAWDGNGRANWCNAPPRPWA